MREPRRWTRLTLIVVGVLAAAAACSSGGGDSATSTADSNSSSGGTNGGTSSGSEDNCFRVGNACECDDGRRGVYECQGGEDVCNCELCVQLSPQEFAFDACGGEPAGTWVLTDAATFDASIVITNELTGNNRVCEADTKLNDVDALDFRLVFTDDGDAELYVSAYASTYWYDEACVEEGLGTSCESTDWDTLDCAGEPCGLCSCPLSYPESNQTGTWTRSDSVLTIETDAGSIDYDYCVGADQMQLVADGLSLVFARAYTSSDPMPCAERELDACSGGCTLGQCVGNADCAKSNQEASCVTRQGCTWDTEVCVGSPDECGLADYGKVPGCEFVDAQPSCSGEREACEDQTLESCETVEGCELTPDEDSCQGELTPCAELTPERCEEAPGCNLG